MMNLRQRGVLVTVAVIFALYLFTHIAMVMRISSSSSSSSSSLSSSSASTSASSFQFRVESRKRRKQINTNDDDYYEDDETDDEPINDKPSVKEALKPTLNQNLEIQSLMKRISRLKGQKEVLQVKNDDLSQRVERLSAAVDEASRDAAESANREADAVARHLSALHGPVAIANAQREERNRQRLRDMRDDLNRQRNAVAAMKVMIRMQERAAPQGNSAAGAAPKVTPASTPSPTPVNKVVLPPGGDTVQVPFATTVEFIRHFNRVSPWHNYDRFKSVVDGGDYIPIVVRAHRRARNMAQMFERLATAARINETVLIVSHDSLDPDVLRMVANVSFMAVKQLVNPHSANIWLDRFPGTDNATTPDRYDQFKHRRDNAVFPGMKHHFWWQLHEVFERVVPTSVRDIAMMEEDHVPNFDIYIVLRSLVRSLPRICPECAGVVLGHHTNWDQRVHKVAQNAPRDFRPIGGPFTLGKVAHNINVGLTMSRAIFEKVKQNANYFCGFNDYNWDITLEYMRTKGFIPSHYLVPTYSRLHHNGLCGAVHDLWGGQCARFETTVLNTIDTDLNVKFHNLYSEALLQYRRAQKHLPTPLPPITTFAPTPQPRLGVAAPPPQKLVLNFAPHTLTFEDDDEFFPIDMVEGMWTSSSVPQDKAGGVNGNGGYVLADQQLCLEISRQAKHGDGYVNNTTSTIANDINNATTMTNATTTSTTATTTSTTATTTSTTRTTTARETVMPVLHSSKLDNNHRVVVGVLHAGKGSPSSTSSHKPAAPTSNHKLSSTTSHHGKGSPRSTSTITSVAPSTTTASTTTTTLTDEQERVRDGDDSYGTDIEDEEDEAVIDEFIKQEYGHDDLEEDSKEQQ
jgi:ribosomal protein S27AE